MPIWNRSEFVLIKIPYRINHVLMLVRRGGYSTLGPYPKIRHWVRLRLNKSIPKAWIVAFVGQFERFRSVRRDVTYNGMLCACLNSDEAVQKIEKKVTFARLMNKFQSEMSSTSSEVDGQSKRNLRRPCPNQASDSLSSLDYTLGMT